MSRKKIGQMTRGRMIRILSAIVLEEHGGEMRVDALMQALAQMKLEKHEIMNALGVGTTIKVRYTPDGEIATLKTPPKKKASGRRKAKTSKKKKRKKKSGPGLSAKDAPQGIACHEFIIWCIKKLPEEGYTTIHSTYSGMTTEFKIRWPDSDVATEVKVLAKRGLLTWRPVTRGAILSLTDKGKEYSVNWV